MRSPSASSSWSWAQNSYNCRYSAEIEIQFENSCTRIVIRSPRKSNQLMSVTHLTATNNFIKIRRQRFELTDRQTDRGIYTTSLADINRIKSGVDVILARHRFKNALSRSKTELKHWPLSLPYLVE